MGDGGGALSRGRGGEIGPAGSGFAAVESFDVCGGVTLRKGASGANETVYGIRAYETGGATTVNRCFEIL